MSDFVQTMKDWRRMCKAFTTDDDSCCEGCPMIGFRECGCGAIFEMDDSTNWRQYADAIAAWAAEHPEPQYPTWVEWLSKQGFVELKNGQFVRQTGNEYVYECKTVAIFTDKAAVPIHADIAQKLGIEPKEK